MQWSIKLAPVVAGEPDIAQMDAGEMVPVDSAGKGVQMRPRSCALTPEHLGSLAN